MLGGVYSKIRISEQKPTPPAGRPPRTREFYGLTPAGRGHHNPLSNPCGRWTPQPNILTPARGNLTYPKLRFFLNDARGREYLLTYILIWDRTKKVAAVISPPPANYKFDEKVANLVVSQLSIYVSRSPPPIGHPTNPPPGIIQNKS